MILVVTACLISGLTRATNDPTTQNDNSTTINQQQYNSTASSDQNSPHEIKSNWNLGIVFAIVVVCDIVFIILC